MKKKKKGTASMERRDFLKRLGMGAAAAGALVVPDKIARALVKDGKEKEEEGELFPSKICDKQYLKRGDKWEEAESGFTKEEIGWYEAVKEWQKKQLEEKKWEYPYKWENDGPVDTIHEGNTRYWRGEPIDVVFKDGKWHPKEVGEYIKDVNDTISKEMGLEKSPEKWENIYKKLGEPTVTTEYGPAGQPIRQMNDTGRAVEKYLKDDLEHMRRGKDISIWPNRNSEMSTNLGKAVSVEYKKTADEHSAYDTIVVTCEYGHVHIETLPLAEEGKVVDTNLLTGIISAGNIVIHFKHYHLLKDIKSNLTLPEGKEAAIVRVHYT